MCGACGVDAGCVSLFVCLKGKKHIPKLNQSYHHIYAPSHSCIYFHSSDLAPTNPTGQFEERGIELYLAYIRQPDPPGEEPKLAYRCVIGVGD